MEEKKKDSAAVIGGVIFVGCMFLGAGIGMLYNKVAVGSTIGMGTGFILMGAIWAYYKKTD